MTSRAVRRYDSGHRKRSFKNTIQFSRTGIGPDESMRNVIRLVRETRKTAGEVAIADVADWSFARKAQ